VIVATLVPLQLTGLILVALGAPAIAFTRDPLRQIVVAGLYSWALAILFTIFAAPDVALSMIVVGAVGYPLVVLVAIARTRKGKDE
jgi:energy-converting hydrogenase B subunit D